MDSKCGHKRTEHISGDLVCLVCGKVVQSNSLLTTEPNVSELMQSSRNGGKFAPTPVQLQPNLSHEARSLADLHKLAVSLINAFALKTTYEEEAFRLMNLYWESTGSAFRFGKSGYRLLVACLFLLARRDHLAVSLATVAESIQSTCFECGQFIVPLTQLEPSLRCLATPSDFVEHELGALAHKLTIQHGLVIVESKIHDLVSQAIKIASLLQDTGSSTSSQSIALAASWIALDAFLHSDSALFQGLISEKAVERAVHEIIADNSALSIRNVTGKRNSLIDLLLEVGKSNLPATFTTLPPTKPRRYALLLSFLEQVLAFL